MSLCLIREPSEEESKNGTGLKFEKIKAKNVTDLRRDNKPQIQEVQQIPKDNFVKYTLTCIIMKYQNPKTMKSFQKSKEPQLL